MKQTKMGGGNCKTKYDRRTEPKINRMRERELKMNKKDVIVEISKKTGMSQKENLYGCESNQQLPSKE